MVAREFPSLPDITQPNLARGMAASKNQICIACALRLIEGTSDAAPGHMRAAKMRSHILSALTMMDSSRSCGQASRSLAACA
jgi:hypothetical protein